MIELVLTILVFTVPIITYFAGYTSGRKDLLFNLKLKRRFRKTVAKHLERMKEIREWQKELDKMEKIKGLTK